MPSDAVFRSSLVWLAALVVVMGLYTQSLKKMMATYLLGMFVIAGVLLPDWEFFDRDVSLWGSPISATHSSTGGRPPPPPAPARFRIYPVRLAIYTMVYGFAFYEWWMFVSN